MSVGVCCCGDDDDDDGVAWGVVRELRGGGRGFCVVAAIWDLSACVGNLRAVLGFDGTILDIAVPMIDAMVVLVVMRCCCIGVVVVLLGLDQYLECDGTVQIGCACFFFFDGGVVVDDVGVLYSTEYSGLSGLSYARVHA